MSPYISRGLISTRQIYEHVRSLNIPFYKAEKFIQELAWRDYWQQISIAKGDLIYSDLKQEQKPVSNHFIPKSIVDASTKIEAVDLAIKALYESGYMHNHMRMYVASLCCNLAQSHWKQASQWLYAHLLDGDFASNILSWQWVAGSNSKKKYYANQENINKYFFTKQKDTFLDVSYDLFARLGIPEILKEVVHFSLKTELPHVSKPKLAQNKTTLIYNYYNLDLNWHKTEDVSRVLLLEPSIFEKHPVSEKCIKFALDLSKNIEGIEIFVGEFDELAQIVSQKNLKFKEHPLNNHYQGKEEPRDWLSTVQGYFPSFFAFWKKCKKELVW